MLWGVFGFVYAALASGGLLLPWRWMSVAAVLLFCLNFLPLLFARGLSTRRLLVCRHSVCCLRGFLFSLPVCAAAHVVALVCGFGWKTVLASAVFCVIAESVLFWNGMLCAYGASVQLGLRHRAVGILCGLVPVLHLVVLVRMVRVVDAEVDFEERKNRLDEERRAQRICATRYPLLLVHGVFFRDFKFPPYWGRIPTALQRNGAQVFYGEHQSAAAVADSAKELAARIEAVCAESGCAKVNIIAHSKGGLDARAAAVLCPDRIASVITVNTPHRGCGFADFLLSKVPTGVQQRIARMYNAAAHRLGDPTPDFLAAVRDLTAARCKAFDETHPVPSGIFCKSIGSVLRKPSGGKFPLNFTYRLAGYFDGPNDGLVSVPSFRFGEDFTLLTPSGRRGISHGDMIDLNRENIEGFDVREFYVQLVHELKERGL